MRNRTVSNEKSKPVLDEQTLSKLLEAAYVIQEHNRGMQKPDSATGLKQGKSNSGQPEDRNNSAAPGREPEARNGNALALEKIVETQHDIQVRHLGLENALQLVADRVADIANGCGAAIGLVEGTTVYYRAVSGGSTPAVGIAVAANKSLCAPCLKTGKAFRSTDTSQETLLDSQECRKRGIRSLISVPIFHDSSVAGGLELYYASPSAFTDQDLHSCQLMAGLVTEALTRDKEINRKKSLASERITMLEALEKLQPNLAALIEKPTARSSATPQVPAAESKSYSCRKCGHQLVMEEQFCGKCGTPRAGDYEAPGMQSKLASMWQMQSSQAKDSSVAAKGAPDRGNPPNEPVAGGADFQAFPLEEQLPELFATGDVAPAGPEKLVVQKLGPAEIEGQEQESLADEDSVPGEELRPPEALAVVHAAHPSHWGSAASAREFLEKFVSSKKRGSLLQLWNSHRGDIYLALAVVLVVCVIGWGVRSDHSAKPAKGPAVAGASRGTPAPEPDLSFFEKVLIQLGLAEPPPTQEDKGNPGVQVWVDIHTALYYCPGNDMYGKTPQGKFTTQRQAQLDQFEPAYRKACK